MKAESPSTRAMRLAETSVCPLRRRIWRTVPSAGEAAAKTTGLRSAKNDGSSTARRARLASGSTRTTRVLARGAPSFFSASTSVAFSIIWAVVSR